jgi:prepilin-type N-terminal cleavage/methylation domain-containing protein
VRHARVHPALERRSTRAGGFTLVELICVMVVVATLGSLVGQIIFNLARAQTETAVRSQLFADANIAMERVVNMVKYTPVRAGSPQTPALQFVDTDSVLWENNDDLDFTPASGSTPGRLMLRSVRDGDSSGGSELVLVENVSAFSVEPLNDVDQNLFTQLGVTSLSTPTNTGQVHSMNLDLTLTRGGVSARLRTRVFLRANMELTSQ